MNYLIFFPEECRGSDRAVIAGDRMQYVQHWHKLRPGITVSAGIWGGHRGSATILSVSDGHIECTLDCAKPPLIKVPIALIVATPRPQTVKKTLQAAMSFGAAELHFIKSENVVPSYLSSTTLQEEAIRLEILKAMEQTGDTIPVAVSVHKNWNYFIREKLPALAAAYPKRFLAHTRSETAEQVHGEDALFAIGPESGWTAEEVNEFCTHGFHQISLGERMLRVEHAVARCLSLGSSLFPLPF